MRSRRPTRALLFPICLVASLSGCQTSRPLPVLVRDVETKQPIAGAEVRVWYPLRRSGLGPHEAAGATAADGIVRLPALADENVGMTVEANAHGYLFGETSVPAETVRELKPASFWHANERPPAGVVLELLAEPRPFIELVVPTGYRGKVRAEVHLSDDAAGPPGQRCFEYVVSPRGDVQIHGPALLRLVTGTDYRARYANGTPLRQHADPVAIGLHWLKAEGDDQWFVVGTQGDYEDIRADLGAAVHNRPAQSGRGGGHGGGRGGHRRGGQAPSS